MKKIFIIALAVATMSSCGVLSKYHREKVIGEVKTDSIYGDALSGDSLGLGDMQWRDLFTDPQLQTLIEKALAQNTNIQDAALQIQQAQYALNASKTSFIPNITFSPNGAFTKFLDPYNRNTYEGNWTYGTTLTVGWSNYNFLNLVNQLSMAKVSKLRMENAKQAVQASLVANVASMYYTLSELDQSLEVVSQTRDNWKKYVDMGQYLMNAGQANAAAIASYQATYYAICESVVTIKDNIRIVENSLTTLLKQNPGTLSGCHSADALDRYKAPAIITTGAPISILSRRPDVRDAEYAVRNAFYDKQAAESKFYPSVSLTASGNFTNSLGTAIINPGEFITSAAAGLVQPIWDGGQIRATWKVKKSALKVAINDFAQALVKAGNEVNTAMVKVHSAEELKGLIGKEVEARQRAYDATMALYSNSNVNYLNVITAQNSLLEARTDQIANRMDAIDATIELYQALGGGSQLPPIAVTQTSEVKKQK